MLTVDIPLLSMLMLLSIGYHLRHPTCLFYLSIQPQHKPHKTLFPSVHLLLHVGSPTVPLVLRAESPTVPLVLRADLLLQKHVLVAVETCSAATAKSRGLLLLSSFCVIMSSV